jgi:hypothetical protein
VEDFGPVEGYRGGCAVLGDEEPGVDRIHGCIPQGLKPRRLDDVARASRVLPKVQQADDTI